MQKRDIYRCQVCGNLIEVVSVGGGTLTCCSQSMTAQNENTTDASVEKHVPVVEQKGGKVKVTVGSVIHPMVENHYIQFIEVLTATKAYRKDLKPGDEPVAEFLIEEPIVNVREYCNLHGLWAKK